VKKNILILYTELAGYTVACLKTFCRIYPEIKIHLVRWPVNAEAPFDFSFSDAITVHERSKFDREGLKKLAMEVDPALILCSGWIDKDYVAVCSEWKNKINVVLVMDNKWEGSVKQHLLSLASSFSVLKWFNEVWVTGESQKRFALKLGFPMNKIRTGFYSADVDFFETIGKSNLKTKEENFPHRFIYAGRYYDFKGVKELWEGFIRFKEKNKNDWELWCLGTGDIKPVEHPSIRHFGFVQPSGMAEIMQQCGVFILPSRIEPWGVVVHEFAAAGFPLLLSEEIGAAEVFLEEGKNGFSFTAGSSHAISEVFEKTTLLDNRQLFEMGKISAEKAKTITPEKWGAVLFSLIPSR
jgi:glycosyltransferase involved in cell wall biosynthesis